MKKPRFDIVYGENYVRLDYHFCREWDDEGGCYGTNPNHGLSWDEAKQEMIAYLQGQIEYWQKLTLKKWQAP